MKFSSILTMAAAVAATAISPRQMGGGGSSSGSQSGGSGSSGSGSSGSGMSAGNAAVAGSSSTTTTTAAAVAATSQTTTGTAAASTATTQTTTTDTACNNAASLCDRQYNNVTHMGAHDSSFLRDSSTSYSIAGTQYYNATWALDAGLRLLQVQVHVENSTLRMCHTSCSILDAGPLEDWLGDVKTWMDDNPYEVVTILIVNSDDADASDFGEVYTSSGISEYGYTPESTSVTSSWPTLRTMIEANTRLVTFVAAITYNSTYPYILNEWTYMFETAYEVTSLDGFNCTLDRPTSLSSAASAVSSGYLPLMNHFLYKKYDILTYSIEIPNVDSIDTTNSDSLNTTGALGLHGSECTEEYGIQPVFVLVDFWNRGPSMDTADYLNNVTNPTGRTHTDLTNSGGSSSSSAAHSVRPQDSISGSSFALSVFAAVIIVWGI